MAAKVLGTPSLYPGAAEGALGPRGRRVVGSTQGLPHSSRCPGEASALSQVVILSGVYVVAAVALVMGGLIYLLAYLRGRRVTILEALFNWAVVVTAAVTASLMYLE